MTYHPGHMTQGLTTNEGVVVAQQTPAPLLLIPGLSGPSDGLTTAAAKIFPGFERAVFDHRSRECLGGFEELADLAVASLPTDAPMYVCGESFGGPIALTLARRYPTRVRGLILLSTFARLPLAGGWRARMLMPLWSRLVEHMPLLAYGARIAAMPGQFGRWVPVTSMRTYLRGPLASGSQYRHKVDLIAGFDARPWLGELTCPSLVLVARRDLLVPVPSGRELASGLPASTLRELPCGHLSYLALPMTIRTLVEQWRSAVEPSQS